VADTDEYTRQLQAKYDALLNKSGEQQAQIAQLEFRLQCAYDAVARYKAERDQLRCERGGR